MTPKITYMNRLIPFIVRHEREELPPLAESATVADKAQWEVRRRQQQRPGNPGFVCLVDQEGRRVYSTNHPLQEEWEEAILAEYDKLPQE